MKTLLLPLALNTLACSQYEPHAFPNLRVEVIDSKKEQDDHSYISRCYEQKYRDLYQKVFELGLGKRSIDSSVHLIASQELCEDAEALDDEVRLTRARFQTIQRYLDGYESPNAPEGFYDSTHALDTNITLSPTLDDEGQTDVEVICSDKMTDVDITDSDTFKFQNQFGAPERVDFYYVTSIYDSIQTFRGYAWYHDPESTFDRGIFIEKDYIISPIVGGHELGHHLGIRHPNSWIFGAPDQRTCTDSGDGLCMTPIQEDCEWELNGNELSCDGSLVDQSSRAAIVGNIMQNEFPEGAYNTVFNEETVSMMLCHLDEHGTD